MLGSILTRDPSALEVGASLYCLACNDAGGIVDDLIVYRPAEDRFLVVCNAANAGKVEAILRGTARPEPVSIIDEAPETVLLAVQGPAAVGQLMRALSETLAAVPRRHCRELVIEGERYFCARTGYTGEDGFEVMTSPTAAEAMLQRLLDEGCVPCGLAARDSLRLEAALPLHGADINETTQPWEAGLGWAVALDHEFTGRDALLASKDSGTRRLACLVAEEGGVLRGHQAIFSADGEVGTLTSGGFSPSLGRGIGMGYLPRRLARAGTALSVDLRGRRLPCNTVARPFYRSPHLGAGNPGG
jgi:aminomethyltransferase